MSLILLALAVLLCSGLLSLLLGRNPSRANFIGVGGVTLGCLIGILPAARILWTGQAESLRWAWSVPYGSFYLHVDALSAFFLVPILGLSAVAALFGGKYLLTYRDRKNLGGAWFFFNLLVASMAMVVMARNGVLFLLSWEAMSLASFFLVTFENERETVRQAGMTYLVATHLGTAFLLVLFILLGRGTETLDFDQLAGLGLQENGLANLAFVLAVIGFGTKAGFVPLHVWLPEAHPAAPSHVSAVMSGVMIKTGIYGLLRTLTFLGSPEPWWGWALIGLGLVSGILGVLFALAQHDLKRLLAYHSVENIGIIGLGLGLGLLGIALDQPVLAVLGFGGGILHVLNHAIFKGLLFLGAGAVLQATHTRDIDQLGGLIKRMPWTAALFLTGSLAICGLPPLNGFVSEFMIYVAAFKGLGSVSSTVAGVAVLGGLAVIGGLAVACFAKAFGVVFLGEPRSARAAQGQEVAWPLRVPMLLLALGCLAIAFLAPQMVGLLKPVLEVVTGLHGEIVQQGLMVVLPPLHSVVLVSGFFLLLLAVLVWGRRRLLAGRPVGASVTWDCGYALPTARMQYTASSFAQPLTRMFNIFLRIRRDYQAPQGYFPKQASLHTHSEDLFSKNLYEPIFRGIERLMLWTHRLQQGRVQMYLLYIAVTVLVLLIGYLR
jgi:formate hydrogenlyase subunit 3/multisubunit Na+/H+ antiporter MnhD subunit